MILLAVDPRLLKQAADHMGVLDLHMLVLRVHTTDHALLRPVDIVEASVTGFVVEFDGHLTGNVVAGDTVVLADVMAVVVVVVDTCVVADRVAGACKVVVPANKVVVVVVVVDKAVVGKVAAGAAD